MFKNINFNDYFAKAVVLKGQIEDIADLKNKKEMSQILGSFLMAFPSGPDQMICRAIFDVMFAEDVSARKLIDKMINGMNAIAPQKATDMSDVYSKALAFVSLKKRERDKAINDAASDSGGERLTEEEKQGSSKYDDKNGRAADPFIVMNVQDPNRVFRSGEVVFESGNTKIESPSQKALADAEVANRKVLEARKLKEMKDREEEIERKRRAYEESLKRRRDKAKLGEALTKLDQLTRTKD